MPAPSLARRAMVRLCGKPTVRLPEQAVISPVPRNLVPDNKGSLSTAHNQHIPDHLNSPSYSIYW
ncbi:MAG: hypothetical protein IPP22_00030 [Nitrosomonas sp.]|nr:hypothetical protein [Nitrosomonas sp.]